MWSARKKDKVDEAASLPQTLSLDDLGVTSPQTIATGEGMSSFLPSSLFTSLNTVPPQYVTSSMPNPSFPSFTTPPFTATTSYSLFPSSSLSHPQPHFNQSMNLPSLSDSQKFTSTNFHTWHLFMQLLLESAGVWAIIANPSAVDPAFASMMDARA